MITKVCQFGAAAPGGERLVEVFHPGDMERAACFFGMGKTAAPMLAPIEEYLSQLKPHPDKIHVLVNALGAGEFYGSNINGDYFPEVSLLHRGQDFGYETFYNAHPYLHHQNKNPEKSFGSVEVSCWHDDMKRVELVVCISRDLARRFGAEGVVDKLDQGLFPDVSMGTKVPYDTCSICLDWDKYREAQSTFDPARFKTVGQAVLAFHRKNPIRGLSVTRNDYCEHLKRQLNRILPDGRKVYAINDYPRFFDISFVFIGADKTAKVMAKLGSGLYVVVPSWQVAELQGYGQMEGEMEKAAGIADSVVRFARALPRDVVKTYHPDTASFKAVSRMAERAERAAERKEGKSKLSGLDLVRAKLREKKASQRKGAEIIKEVVPSQFGGKAVTVDRPTPDLPNEVLNQLGSCPLQEALSTPTTMGVLLRPREFQRIMIVSIGRGDLADKMDNAGAIFPPTGERDTQVPMGPDHFSEAIRDLLLPFLRSRSMLEPVAQRRLAEEASAKAMQDQPTAVEEAPIAAVKTAQENPFLRKIAAAYNGYLDRAPMCLRKSAEVTNADGVLYAEVFHTRLADGFEKNAAGTKVNPSVVLGAAGAGYALSEYARWQREKARMGSRPPVGMLMDTVAEHPKLMAFLGLMAGMQQQKSTIPRRVVEGIRGFAKNPNV